MKLSTIVFLSLCSASCLIGWFLPNVKIEQVKDSQKDVGLQYHKGMTNDFGIEKVIKPNGFYASVTNYLTIYQSQQQPENITFCMAQRRVVLNVLTGRLSFEGSVDEAARTFWDAVVIAYPDVKRQIIDQYLKENK